MAAEGVQRTGGAVGRATRQWGRDRMAAEGRYDDAATRERRAASMGPRPDGRGRSTECSTGSATGSVNGAATGWPRKGTCGGWGGGSACSVNGAATGWPRKDGIQPFPGLGPLGRQWGRDRMAAEGAQADPILGGLCASMGPRPDGRGRLGPLRGAGWIVSASMGPRPDGRGRFVIQPSLAWPGPASMGPRPDGRGRAVLPSMVTATLKRQWGRDRMAAEGSPPAMPAPTAASVNGAATGWPRKAAAARTTRRCRRRVNGAATGWPRKAFSAPGQLSLGSLRQWGRDRMAAEGRRAVAGGQAPRERQWGRDRMAAEGTPCRKAKGD